MPKGSCPSWSHQQSQCFDQQSQSWRENHECNQISWLCLTEVYKGGKSLGQAPGLHLVDLLAAQGLHWSTAEELSRLSTHSKRCVRCVESSVTPAYRSTGWRALGCLSAHTLGMCC